MPEIVLGDLSKASEVRQAYAKILATMAWPADEPARRKFLVAIAGDLVGQWENLFDEVATLMAAPIELTEEDLSSSSTEEWSYVESNETVQEAWETDSALFNEQGGLIELADAPGISHQFDDLQRRTKHMLTAGFLLFLIRNMTAHDDLKGGASINKAAWIVEKLKPPGAHRNVRDILKCWSQFKPVAHWCAALFEYFNESVDAHRSGKTDFPDVEERILDDIGRFLGIAEVYEDFAATHVPLHTVGATLCDRRLQWRVPRPRTWPKVDWPPQRLSPPVLTIAREYNAPRRAQ